MYKNNLRLTVLFISLLITGQTFANEITPPLFVAVQISNNVIKLFAEYSEGVWKTVDLKSNKVDLSYEMLADGRPWEFKPKQAKLSDVTINDFTGNQLSRWYSVGSKQPLIVSQFTQYGNNIESERTGWGMTVSGQEALSVSEDWYEYPIKLLFSRVVLAATFKPDETGIVEQSLYKHFQERLIQTEEAEAKTNLSRCYDKNRSEELNVYAAGYCEYWEHYSDVIKRVQPKMLVKKASLVGLDLYFIEVNKSTPLKETEACPRETQAQAWAFRTEGSISVISEKIVLTDCDGKESGSIVVPFAIAEIDEKFFVFSENFGYEGSGYVIREFKGDKLESVFNPDMYEEGW